MNARTVLHDAARTLSATGVYLVALQLVGILVVHLLGVSGRGEVAAAVLVPTIIAAVGSMGVPVATGYLLNALPKNREVVIGTSRTIILALSLVMGFISLVVCWFFPIHQSVRIAAILFTLYVPFNLLAALHQAVLQSDLRIRAFNFVRLSGVLTYLALVIGLMAVDASSVVAIVLAQLAGNAVWLVLSAVLTRNGPWFAFDRGVARSLLGFGTRAHLGGMGTVDNLRIDQLVLALFLSTYDLGLYVVAMSFFMANRMIGTSVGMVAFPVAARTAGSNQRRRLLAALLALTVVLSLFAVAVELLYGRQLLRLFFDVSDSKARDVLALAAIASLFVNLRQVLNDILRGRGRPAIPTIGELVALVTLGISALLLWNRGVVGVGWAILIAYLLGFLTVVALGSSSIHPKQVPWPSLSRGFGTIGRACPVIAILLAAVGAGWLLTLRRYTDTDGYLFLLVLLLIVMLFPIVRRIATHRFDPFEPIVLFFFAFGTMFVVRPLAIIARNDFVYERPTLNIDFQSSFASLLVIALLGGTAFVIGYELPIGRRLARVAPNPPSNFHADTVVAGSLLLSCLGLGLFALFIMQSGGVATLLSFLRGRDVINQVQFTRQSTGYLYLGHYLLIPATLILFALGRSHRNFVLICFSILLTGVLLVRAAPSGSRMTLLPFIGGFFVYWYVSRRRRPSKVGIVALVVIALMGSTLLREIRVVTIGESRSVASTFVETVTHPQTAFQPLAEGADNEMAEVFAAALTYFPEEFQHLYGRATFGDFFIRPIPRTAWPDKPVIPRVDVISTLWPYEYEIGIANQEFTSLFFFYLDFGYGGVVLWMAAYGIIARAFYQYFLNHPKSMPAQIVYSLGLTFLPIALRDSPVDTLARMCFIMLPAVVIFSIAKVRRPAPSSVPNRVGTRPISLETGAS